MCRIKGKFAFENHAIFCDFNGECKSSTYIRHISRHYNINHINISIKLICLDKNGYKTTTKGDEWFCYKKIRPFGRIFNQFDKFNSRL